MGPLRYTLTERLLTDEAKATLNQAALDIDIRIVDDFNKVLLEMTKHAFPACAFREQKRYLHRHLVKPRSMILCSFISRLQELILPDTGGQKMHLYLQMKSWTSSTIPCPLRGKTR